MIKGLFLLLWVGIISFIFGRNSLEPDPTLICGNYKIKRAKKSYAILLFLLPFVFAAFKTEFVDTAGYLNAFIKIDTSISFSEFFSSRKDNLLFYEIEYLFKKYISTSHTFFFALIALLQSTLLVSTLRKYSEDLGMSIYLFITSALFFNWMCNGIRQFIVVTILFALTKYILNGKWYIYLPVVLILSGVAPIFNMFGWGEPPWFLSGIHQSAFIMLPIYFIVRGKALTKKVWILLAVLLALSAFGLLDLFLETSTKNTMYAADLEYIDEGSGANPIRFLVSLIPVLLVLIKRKEVLNEDTPAIINLSINMAFVSSTLYLASVFTSGIFVGRLPIYCELYTLILIPWIINKFDEGNKRTIKLFLYIMYFFYYCYQLFVAWGDLTYTVSLFGVEF